MCKLLPLLCINCSRACHLHWQEICALNCISIFEIKQTSYTETAKFPGVTRLIYACFRHFCFQCQDMWLIWSYLIHGYAQDGFHTNVIFCCRNHLWAIHHQLDLLPHTRHTAQILEKPDKKKETIHHMCPNIIANTKHMHSWNYGWRYAHLPALIEKCVFREKLKGFVLWQKFALNILHTVGEYKAKIAIFRTVDTTKGMKKT